MRPTHHFLQLVPKRLNRTLERLKESFWSPLEHQLSIETSSITAKRLSFAEATALAYEPVRGRFFWGKDHDQRWFRVNLPPDRPEDTFLEWIDQGESTLYFSDSPWAGFDPGHTHVRLPENVAIGWIRVVAVNPQMPPASSTARQADGSYIFRAARLVQKNGEAWNAYYDLEVLYRLLEVEFRKYVGNESPFPGGVGYLPELGRISPFYRQLCRALDNAINIFESNGLAAFRAELKQLYTQFRDESPDLEVWVSGHAHIDLVWLWSEAVGREKIVHSCANVDYLLREYPEMVFGFSQSAAYRALEAMEPALFAKLRTRMCEGQWEATGAAEVECDTQLPCGEALVRNVLMGREYLRALPGSSADVFWLPDTFGYSSVIPQILQQCGVSYFFTTKLTWRSITPFPYSSFVWQGIDGSEVLAHVTHQVGYVGEARVAEIQRIAENYRQADIHRACLLPTGLGDGGGGPTAATCERMRRMGSLKGLPSAKWSRIDDYFRNLAETRARLPHYQGELFLEYHRGVHTSHGSLKLSYRRLESALRALEAAHVVHQLGPIDKKLWRRAIFTQFHDYLPGSSIPEVYRDGIPELKELTETALSEVKRVLEDKTATGATEPCLFNPLPVPLPIHHQGGLIILPPLSGIAESGLSPQRPERLIATETRLENERLRADFFPSGRLRALSIDGRDIPFGGEAGKLVLYPDFPHLFPAWDIDRPTLSNGEAVEVEPISVEAATANGIATLRFRIEVGMVFSATIIYSLLPHRAHLEVTYEIDWNGSDKLLKVEFPTHFASSAARFGAPFGSVLRSQFPGKSEDEAQWECPASRWAAVRDEGDRDGFFIVTEAKYGFGCQSGTLDVSLLRGARMPSAAGGDSGFGTHLSGPTHSDLGFHRIRLAIGRFAPEESHHFDPALLAETLFQPPIRYHGIPFPSICPQLSSAPTLHPLWTKPSEDGAGWILRLHEVYGRRGKAALHLPSKMKAALTDLSEEPKSSIPYIDGDSIPYRPYEIISLRFS